MSTFLFPDNTVLCNFAAVERLDLLETVLNGRGRWTAAVAFEAGRSVRFLPALARIAIAGWLDEPVEITAERDVQRVNRVRRAVFGGTDDEPLKHLGEAETCFVIKEWDGVRRFVVDLGRPRRSAIRPLSGHHDLRDDRPSRALPSPMATSQPSRHSRS